MPGADALIVIGPPIATHVAVPVFESIVARFVSEEVHLADTFVCIIGA